VESFASAGMSGVCLVLLSLEAAELQHELLSLSDLRNKNAMSATQG
jgi:hypothetical protein